MKEDILNYLKELEEKYSGVGIRDIAKRSVIKEIENFIINYKKEKSNERQN